MISTVSHSTLPFAIPLLPMASLPVLLSLLDSRRAMAQALFIALTAGRFCIYLCDPLTDEFALPPAGCPPLPQAVTSGEWGMWVFSFCCSPSPVSMGAGTLGEPGNTG